jgi:hypothetical protein
MNDDRTDFDAQLMASRVIFGVFGFAFGGIGLTVLGFLWGTPFNQFGSPPLFFRIFGSFIALIFVVVGGSTFLAAIAGRRMINQKIPISRFQSRQPEERPLEPLSGSPLHYACSNCGAQLANNSDVSPLGDVKCSFCHQWFNIHRPARS